jgi:4-hydroxy-tetrahydrodipicolinate reductase
MGRAAVKAVWEDAGLELVAAVDVAHTGEDIGEVAGLGALGVRVMDNLADALEQRRPDVMVDFTNPSAVLGSLRTALSRGVRCVVGTTGLSEADLTEVAQLCADHDTAAVICPNFSLGANLMMRFAAEAATRYETAEIIELHHEQKKDAPSGTALSTAARMAEARGGDLHAARTEVVKLDGARGGLAHGIPIHSVRLPGFVAHQEVIFGGPGETLTIRHDSTGRESFMPGMILAIREVMRRPGLTYGLEQLLDRPL